MSRCLKCHINEATICTPCAEEIEKMKAHGLMVIATAHRDAHKKQDARIVELETDITKHQAVNSHEALVAACEALLSKLRRMSRDCACGGESLCICHGGECEYCKAKAALATAKEGGE